MGNESDLFKLKPKSPSKILEKLSKSRRNSPEGGTGGAPLTTIHLRSGRDISGWVLKLEEELGHAGATLLFQALGQSQNTSDDIVYLDVANIEAVTIHRTTDFLHVISPGKFDPPTSGSEPTRLGLKREVPKITKSFTDAVGGGVQVEVDWDSVPQEDEAVNSLNNLIHESIGAITETLPDDFSKGEFTKKVRSVKFQNGLEPVVTLTGDVLVITADLGKGKPGRLDDNTLKTKLNELL